MSAHEVAPPTNAATPRATSWLDVRERGTLLGIQTLALVCRLLGRSFARGIIALVAFHYTLFDVRARRVSRAYLARVHPRVTTRLVFSHLLRFCQVSLDRIFLVMGRTKYFEVTHTGHEHLVKQRESGHGAVLLGAHLGSFEAMRIKAEQYRLPINALGFFRNAQRVNTVLEQLDPQTNARVIAIDTGGVDFVLDVKDRVERGELIGILGDRVASGARSVTVDFLGGRARFPTGPFLLAATLRCPIYLVFGLHRAPNHYDLYCEPFTELLVLPRKAREQALQEAVQRFAVRLEHYVRLAPDNWFNFFDFWETP